MLRSRIIKLAALANVLAIAAVTPTVAAAATPAVVSNGYSCFVSSSTGTTIRAIPPARMDPAPGARLLGGTVDNGYVYWRADVYRQDPSTGNFNPVNTVTTLPWLRAYSSGSTLLALNGWGTIWYDYPAGHSYSFLQYTSLSPGRYAVKESYFWSDGQTTYDLANNQFGLPVCVIG